MPSISISSGYPRFADTVGAPLDGKLYFGIPGQNPITAPKQVYWDKDLTQPAAQPLNVSGGYIMRAGTPAGLFTNGDYSLLSQDKAGRTVFYAKTSVEFDNAVKVQESLDSINAFSTNLASKTDMSMGVSLVGGANRVVPTIAVLRTLPKTGSPEAFVTGYYSKGDGGGGYYYYDAIDTTSLDDGGAIIVANDGGRWKLVKTSGVLSLRQFGAKGDGSTDDTSALMNFWSAIKTYRISGYIPKGTYKITSAQTWDFTPISTAGCRIYGDGPNECVLDFSTVATGVPFKWVGLTFYMTFANFAVRTNINGVGFQIGQDDYSDAWNSCRFEKIIVNNNSSGSNNIACRLNYVLQSFVDIVCNSGGTGRPGQPSTPGYGTAVQMRQCAFNHFILAAGNAKTALHITGGYTYGNTFTAMDIEEVDTAIKIDSVNASRNTFINGTIVAVNVFNCTAGQANVFQNPNISLYAGGAEVVAATGLIAEKYSQGGIVTPTLPASGVAYQNTSGRQVQVFVSGGTLTGVSITKSFGGTSGIPGVNSTATTSLILDPMDSITLTYGATAPGWLWLPIN